MPTAIDGLQPALVWKYFAEFARIPRCSKHEAAASQYIVDTARRLGLEATKDQMGNVVVRKPASPGRERARSMCLQGHLDMVCEKEPSSAHDFSKDPIELVRRGNTLMANQTTLGADNGIAVATNLAIMEDRTIEHGPLELLFTVDEETGLTGAHNLQPGFLHSQTLLNLDSEEEGALYVGCAGGRDTVATWTVQREPAPSGMTAMEIRVSGLRGGHSGLEIDKGRGNAIKILNRALLAMGPSRARLSRIQGGNKRNAIPRDAQAVVYVADAAAAEQIVRQVNETIRGELSTVERDLAITAARAGAADGKILTETCHNQITRAIAALPHGVTKMSADIPGLVETSTNVAVVSTADGTVELATSQRSSVASEIEEIVQTVGTIFEMAGARVQYSDGYPGWKPNIDSPVLKVAIATYKTLYGKEPEVKAVHAGLECGIIGEKYPGMDMVSFGPTLEGVHSPDEKIYIDTVPKFWDLLTGILKAA